MSKQNLIDTIAAQQSTSKAEATRVVDAFLSGLQAELAFGRNVTLVGFGTFSVVHKAGRTARNPATGGMVQVRAKNVVKFKPGSNLLKAVN